MTAQTLSIAPPDASEYAPYYGRYTSLVKSDNIIGTLRQQLAETVSLFSGVNEEKGGFRYAPGKWSVKEMLGHMIDAERIFAYRVLRIARNDKTPIEGFEQDDYIPYGQFDGRSMAELLNEFTLVRNSNLALMSSLDRDAWMRRGTASGKEVSVRALAFIMAGHELHHGNVFREKYLPYLKS
jgi:uncharacterized damage-inducible protein DinB